MQDHYLAQLNIAQAIDTMDSATMKGFVDRLDEINALADNSPGFVWRLQTEEGDATTIQAFDDPMLIVNMSVWTDLDALKNYVYKSIHVELIRDRSAWFNKLVTAHQVLWWVPVGHIPTVEEAKAKLQHLEDNGPSEQAFTFAKPF
ncbi:DUF3291 domain-containing protein [Leucothrix mucor]|uniref:DUF3291 domain-containing protein n=1 Tax=Leucothrix mucor TaxID=45248 RepID=UPI0003B3478F|nr:DUF3291 domain-containing protein [Leucothrix mucor]